MNNLFSLEISVKSRSKDVTLPLLEIQFIQFTSAGFFRMSETMLSKILKIKFKVSRGYLNLKYLYRCFKRKNFYQNSYVHLVIQLVRQKLSEFLRFKFLRFDCAKLLTCLSIKQQIKILSIENILIFIHLHLNLIPFIFINILYYNT